MWIFQEKNVSSLSICENALTLQTAFGNFLMLCQMVLLPNIYTLPCLLHKQSIIIKYKCCKQINKYLYCYELHLFSGLFLFLHLNFHPIKNLLTYASGYLKKFCNFYAHLNLETVFPALKLTQICCININISFLENWQFNHKLAPPLLLLTYQT